MKILFLSQGQQISDHPGWHNALIKLRAEGYITDFVNIPYLGYAKDNGWEEFYQIVVALCIEQAFDIVYFHYFQSNFAYSPKLCIEALLNLENKPIIITSVGDGFSENWLTPDYPKVFKEISQIADITFSTQMGKAADKMNNWGAKNVVFSPHSLCQVRFKAQQMINENHSFDFDVVFVGSNNSGNVFNPVSKYWWGGRKRNELVKALHKRFGKRLGLFGNGWQNYSSSQGPTAFHEQQNTFRRGRIVVGGNPYSYADYYASNRPFFEIASGIPTVELLVPRLDKVLKDNEHCYFAADVDELIERCDTLLNTDPEILYTKAATAARYIEEHHTQYHRMKFKLDTVKRYVDNNFQLDVKFPFFLPEVDLLEEKEYAIR